MKFVSVTDASVWDGSAKKLGAHPLQLWGWSEVKKTHHWSAEHIAVIGENDKIIGGAQVLFKKLPAPFGEFAYIPRGPFGSQVAQNELLAQLPQHLKHTRKLLCLSVEQGTETAPGVKGWRKTSNTILMDETVVLDLSHSEEELLADMKKKTRQYIRKSAANCEIRQITSDAEIDDCLMIYKNLAARVGFGLHDDAYYHSVSQLLSEHSKIYGAYVDGELASFLWLAVSPETAFELYGAVNEQGQEARVNYALKWHAITEMKRQGIRFYDLNGLVEGGVSNFKQGFASHETHFAGTFDYPLSPLYPLWRIGFEPAKKLYRTLRR